MATRTDTGINYVEDAGLPSDADIHGDGNLWRKVSARGWVLVHECDASVLARIQRDIDDPESTNYGDTTLIDRYNAGEVL